MSRKKWPPPSQAKREQIRKLGWEILNSITQTAIMVQCYVIEDRIVKGEDGRYYYLVVNLRKTIDATRPIRPQLEGEKEYFLKKMERLEELTKTEMTVGWFQRDKDKLRVQNGKLRTQK